MLFENKCHCCLLIKVMFSLYLMQNLGNFPEEDARILEKAAGKDLRSCHLFALMLAEL